MTNERSVALAGLATLLKRRALIDDEISVMIGRPALKGHIGEYVAAAIFDIELNRSGSAKGNDGFFRGGPFRGRRVNVKFYTRWDGLLDMHVGDGAPEHYLVLAGTGSGSWGIQDAFLFDHAALIAAGVRAGTACSVKRALAEAARVYPGRPDGFFELSHEQAAAIECFRAPTASTTW